MAQELTYKWVQDRLRDLHAGKLSAQDKARLETIALEDPFVADALEGYEAHPDAMHDAYLAALAEKIRHTPRERRRWLIPNLTVTAIAASVMLIIATYAVVSRMEPQPEKETLVILSPDSLLASDTSLHHALVWKENVSDGEGLGDGSTVPPKAGGQKQPSSDQITVTSPEPSSRSKLQSPESRVEREQHAAVAESGTSPEDEIPNPATAEEETRPAIEESKDISVPAVMLDNTVQGKTLSSGQDQGLYANQMNPDLMARRVTGRVINPSGDPLHGADIRVANTNLGVISGDAGHFELFLPLPQSDIEVFLPGYGQVNVQLEQGEMDKDIVLKPTIEDDAISSQKQAERYAQRDDASKPASAGASRAQEISDGLTTYLKANARLPLRNNYYMPGKEVTIEYTIRSNGKPEDLRLLRSSGDRQYDEEALRLIREWDQWKCEEKNCKRVYTLYFE